MSVTGPVNYYIETPVEGSYSDKIQYVNQAIELVFSSLATRHYIDGLLVTHQSNNMFHFSLVVTGANVFEIHKSATAAYYAANEAGYNVAPAANHYTRFE